MDLFPHDSDSAFLKRRPQFEPEHGSIPESCTFGSTIVTVIGTKSHPTLGGGVTGDSRLMGWERFLRAGLVTPGLA